MDAQKPREKELLDGLLDELLKGYKKPEDILGEDDLLQRSSKAVLERALGAELTKHLGYEKHDPAGYGSGNARNGTTEKTLQGKNGEVRIEVPRDRNGTFERQIVKKHQTRFDGFDDKIVSMYARGMTTRDIQGHLEEIYGVEVSPTLICNVTDAVVKQVKAWQGRALEPVYPILYLDALHVKIRDAGHVQNRAIYVAIGVKLDGGKEVLGLWAGQAEGAKFCLQVVTELKNRGVKDILARSRKVQLKLKAHTVTKVEETERYMIVHIDRLGRRLLRCGLPAAMPKGSHVRKAREWRDLWMRKLPLKRRYRPRRASAPGAACG